MDDDELRLLERETLADPTNAEKALRFMAARARRHENGSGPMRLWLITRNTQSRMHDVARSFVVRAPDEDRARVIVSQKAGDEGPKVWLNKKRSRCFPLSHEGVERVILCDYLSG